MDYRKKRCYADNSLKGDFGLNEKFCELVFDSLLCWPATKAGELAVQPCPGISEAVYSINQIEYATRYCEEDGTWYIHPEHNTTWSNYSMCNLNFYNDDTARVEIDISISNQILYLTWLPRIKIISRLGYSLSLITLLFAIGIILSIKKLQCARNILHLHLFSSFVMRAVMFILNDSLLFQGVALQSDFVVDGNDTLITENYHWICKAVTSLRNYSIQANYFFILMEGVYLHNLIYLNLFSDKSSIRIYYVLGWCLPLLFISTWVILRSEYDDTMCWTTHGIKYIAMLTQTPIEISVLINFILFISITRVLCLKINAMHLQQRRMKYRRLIKSTLTLILIYSVPCIISIGLSYTQYQTLELIWIFCDQVFTAFQGLIMALIYCLLNSEVQGEIKHKYSSVRDRHSQKKRVRTISNTQQFSLPLNEDCILEPVKVYTYKDTENL